MVKNLKNFILDILYKPVCVFCGAGIAVVNPELGYICDDCVRNLPFCPESEILAPFFYLGDVRQAVIRFKFRGKTGYSFTFAKIWARYLRETCSAATNGDFIVSWVPCSTVRSFFRGYDQAHMMAKALAKELKLKCKRVLVRKRNSKPQTTANNAQERVKNVKDAFVAKKNLDKTAILLIDDVFTTGATSSECIGILREAKAGRIIFSAFSRKRS